MSLRQAANAVGMVFFAWVRASIHAVMVVALLTFAIGLLTTLAVPNWRLFLLWLGLTLLYTFSIWVVFLIEAVHDFVIDTSLASIQGSQPLFERVITPVSLLSGIALLLLLLLSGPIHFARLWRDQFVLQLALGYFLAPILIRKRVVARTIESFGSG